MPLIRMAVLGCGRIVQLAHLANLRGMPEVRVVAVAEPDERGRALAARELPDARIVPDYRDLLTPGGGSGGEGIDAVLVALPTPLHRDAATAAFSLGWHVYLEKPLAATMPDGEAIVAAWQSAGTIGVMGFNCRFNRLYAEMRQAIAAGEVGDVVAVRSALTACWPADASWRLDPRTGGGALLELASHHVDLCRFLFDTELTAVEARMWSNRGSDEAAALQFDLANGIHGQTLVSYGTVEEDRFEIYGSAGKLVINRYDSLILERVPTYASGGIQSATRRLGQELRAVRYGLAKRRAPGQEPSYGASLASFVRAVGEGRQARPDLADGLAALRAIDAARRSASRHVHGD